MFDYLRGRGIWVRRLVAVNGFWNFDTHLLRLVCQPLIDMTCKSTEGSLQEPKVSKIVYRNKPSACLCDLIRFGIAVASQEGGEWPIRTQVHYPILPS